MATLIVLMLAAVGVGAGAAILRPWRKWLNNPAVVHWLQEIAVHGVFYGFAAALLLGLDKCEPSWAYPVYIVVYILVLGGMSLWLAIHHQRLAKPGHL
ncbi:hypothetical protein [Ramlibacter pallidus]|uniref:Uncharacterized protein n=1 Tax=Ramlibacter pallidus TaxID=2780087 RepID=A0ABR9S2D6_9BURK|nr:hypothetical protein [Ramlibacter pallidus]MBE7367677.1 hypothetical protein [Ramlibacter pallidus]